MKLRLLAAAVVVAAVATACGSSSGSSGSSDSGTASGSSELRSITVGVIPIIESSAAYVARSQGFFAEEGLDVTIEASRTSSTILPSLVSGQYDIGYSTLVTLMMAREKGLELTAIAAATQPGIDSDGAAVVAKDPKLRSAKDLAGKRIGVNALNNIAALSVRAAVKADGGDDSKLQFVELGFAEQAAAVERGDIDAGFIVEPFTATSLEAGLHVVTYPYQAIDPDVVIGSYVVTQSTLNDDPKLVEGFRRALYKAAEYINSNPEVLKATVAEFATIDPAIFDKMAVPRFATELSVSSAQTWAAEMLEQGVLTAKPDMSGVIAD